MKKNLVKMLCLLTIAFAVLCLPTAVFADGEYEDQIYAPIGQGFMDEDGNFVLDADGEEVPLTAEFSGENEGEAEWSVLDGKDIVSIVKREGFENQAILTALADGEATIIAYMEDDSQRVITAKVKVSNQEVVYATSATLATSVEGDGNIIRKAVSGEELPLAHLIRSSTILVWLLI